MDFKAIISNRAALKSKYSSAGLKKIELAVKRLIRADKERGIESRLYDVSDRKTMEDLGGKAVTNTGAPKPNKDAVDAVCSADAPAYVLLLGGPDVIPHQSLANPMDDDPDNDVPSDLPYACDSRYQRDIVKFIGPTRVVGRLPDIEGASDPAYLIKLLETARNYTVRSAKLYKNYMGVSTEAWKDSSRTSARKLFGTSKKMALCPPNDERWPATTLKRRSHFINCHGNEFDPFFYGEREDSPEDQPTALTSEGYIGKIAEGTIAAAECCYGAGMYAPLDALDLAICSRFLGEGAYAFLGSTNVAYGPAEGNSAADYICQFFIDNVLKGASLGRALLQARHEYVRQSSPLGPTDYKTLGQFLLLGDPSVHPVRTTPKPKAKSKNALRDARPMERAQRRKLLQRAGKRLAKTTAMPRDAKPKAMSAAMKKKVLAALATKGIAVGKGVTFALGAATPLGAKSKLKRSRPGACHVIVGKRKLSAKGAGLKKSPIPTKRRGGGTKSRRDRRKAVRDYLESGVVIVAKEVAGRIESIEELRPH